MADRQRDALGRLLPSGVPGVPDVPSVPADPELVLAEAQRLLDAGLPFHAHEVLEAMWKACAPDERELWRGLTQLAVAVTHRGRGNEAGAGALLDRGAGALDGYVAGAPHGIDVAGLVAWARAGGEGVLQLRVT
jgi:hypothetical protein